MHKWTIAGLTALLVLSNAAWAYFYLDLSVTLSYREGLLYETTNHAVALSDLSTELIRGKDRTEIRTLMLKISPSDEPFEKDGSLIGGWLSVSLDANGLAAGMEKDSLWLEWSKPR